MITIDVAGFGTATLGPSNFVFSNQDALPHPAVGISGLAGVVPAEILATIGTTASAFTGYDLTTALGPITGIGIIRPDAFFNTSLGVFNLTSIGDTTFTASLETF